MPTCASPHPRTSPECRLLTLPVGRDHAGLPIGMQLMGPPMGEAVVLRAGHAYEAARNHRGAASPRGGLK